MIGLLGMGAAAVLALLIGWNVSMKLVSYGLLALFLFSILDYIFTALEQKSKDSERFQMDKI
ncbi:hypothetical protein ACF3MZ_23410 [Paenibacillaceae bacterium WGS1546]|uniref:hypothetical protein n=1 Tax=Cohnella sp. WGS1546 TaxID=3366810 RepID=UPI00372CF1B5